jgi:hypothetical protein
MRAGDAMLRKLEGGAEQRRPALLRSTQWMEPTSYPLCWARAREHRRNNRHDPLHDLEALHVV